MQSSKILDSKNNNFMNQQIQQQMVKLNQKQTEYQSQLLKLEEKQKELQQMVKLLEAKQTQKQSKMEEAAQINAQIQQIKYQISLLETQILNISNNITTYENRMSIHEKNIQHYTEQIMATQSKLGGEEQQLASSKAELVRLEGQKAEQEEKLQNIQKAINQLQSQINGLLSLNRLNPLQRQELQKLRSELKGKRQQKGNIKAKISKCTTVIAGTRSRISQLIASVRDLNANLNSLNYGKKNESDCLSSAKSNKAQEQRMLNQNQHKKQTNQSAKQQKISSFTQAKREGKTMSDDIRKMLAQFKEEEKNKTGLLMSTKVKQSEMNQMKNNISNYQQEVQRRKN